MRSPRGRGQQLDLLGSKQRTEFDGEALDEILVGEDRSPVGATVGIVVELPEMARISYTVMAISPESLLAFR